MGGTPAVARCRPGGADNQIPHLAGAEAPPRIFSLTGAERANVLGNLTC